MNPRKVLITNRINSISWFKGKLGQEETLYVSLDCNPRFAIRSALASYGAKDLTGEFFAAARCVRSEYRSFLRILNKRNRSLQWWAMNFTAKDMFLSNLYNEVFYVLAAAQFIRKTQFKNLLIFCSCRRVAKKIKSLEKELGAQVVTDVNVGFGLKAFITRNSPAMIFYSAVKAAARKLLYLAAKRGPEAKRGASARYLIATQFEDRSFGPEGFKDTYFRYLRDFLSNKNIDVLTAGFVMCRFNRLLSNKERNVFAFEKFLKISDILKCLSENLRMYFFNPKPEGCLFVSGVDVADLLKNEIRHSINSGQCFVNLIIYSATLNLLRSHCPARIFYPFEGRPWEKMIIMAAREASSSIKLTGYQHASVNARHTPFILQAGEFREVPFPDEIISSGHITRDIMLGLLNFPSERIKPGCALRQSFPLGDTKVHVPDKIRRILAVLSTRIEEDAMALEFLDKAFKDSQEQDLALRPHPCIDFQKVLRLYRPKNIRYRLDEKPLSESLNSADLLIYASSTVSLEAVFRGIPVIFMELTQDLAADPLFDLPYFKWNCKCPGRLKKIIEDISSMDKAAFLDLQKKAQEYSLSYCVPPTEKAMETFV